MDHLTNIFVPGGIVVQNSFEGLDFELGAPDFLQPMMNSDVGKAVSGEGLLL